MRWTVHLDGGPTRVNHAAVCVGNLIYSFGGYYSSGDYKDWDPITVHILDTTTFRWEPLYYERDNMVPFQRYGHTAVAYHEKVYMWGGRNNSAACEILAYFNTRTFSWITPPVTGSVPYAKDGHSACVIKNKMYIYGGFEYITDQYSQDVHCLNLDTHNWTYIDTKGSPPSHRDFHTAVSVGDRMYVFGGRGDLNSPYNSQEEVYCPQIHYLDVKTEEWSTLNPNGIWPEGRRSHSAWVYKDYMYIFGGFNGNTKTHFNDLYRYSITKNCWEYLNVKGTVPCKRRRQACVLHGDKVYLFGGTSPCPNENSQEVENVDEDIDKLTDNSDLHILDYAPTLRTLSMLAVIKNKLDLISLPRSVVYDIRCMTLPNRISRPNNHSG